MTETKPPVDQDFLSEMSGGDVVVEKDLFDTYSESCKENLAKMERAMKSGDENDWFIAAHSLKGASASIGAFDLSKIFDYAQTHKEENLVQKQEVIKKIRIELKLVIEFFKQKSA